jgi:hypothetical protein
MEYQRMQGQTGIVSAEIAKNQAACTREAGNEQAQAKENEAWGGIAGAGAQLAGEGLALGKEAALSHSTEYRALQDRMNTLNESEAALKNQAGVASLKLAAEDRAPGGIGGGVQLRNLRPPGANDPLHPHMKKVREWHPKDAATPEIAESLGFLHTKADNAKVGKLLEQKRTQIEDERKVIDGAMGRLESRSDRIVQKLQTVSSTLNSGARSTGQLEAAKNEREAADERAGEELFRYSGNTVGEVQKQIERTAQQQDKLTESVEQVQKGLIDQNRA